MNDTVPPPPRRIASSSMKRIAANAMSMLASDVANRATTFLLYALVARYLGAHEFGQMALGLTLFRTFQLLAAAGLKTLITREVAKDKEKTGQYLINSSLVVTVSSLLSVLALVLFTRIMNYAANTSAIIILLSLGLLPFSLGLICDAVFQARERMHYITYANVAVNVAKISLGFVLLASGYGLEQVVLLIIFSHVAILAVKWWLVRRHIVKPGMAISLRFCLAMARSSVTFLGINGVNAVMTSLNVVLLSKFTSEVEVGLYGAATQILVPIFLVFQSIITSIYPVMCRRFEPSFQNLKQLSERLLEFLMIIFIPTVVGLYFLADAALLLLYGNSDFTRAAMALRILSAALILRVFTKVLGLVLIASLRERMTLRILTIDLLATLVCGPILIGHFGLVGAALTALIVRVVDFIQHYVPVSRLLSKIAVGRLLWKPAIASVCMAFSLVLLKDQNLLLNILSSGVLYGTVLSGVVLLSVGGPQQLKARYLHDQWLIQNEPET